MAGNAVGSPLPLRRYGPVTTDPFGERLQSCHSVDVASRRGKSMAGATRGLSAHWKLTFRKQDEQAAQQAWPRTYTERRQPAEMKA
jgi:hypothetical protein